MDLSRPFCADVVDGRAVSQACGEVRLESVVLLFEVENTLEEREGGFDEHALVPGAGLAELEV